MRIETDAWYIDMPAAMTAAPGTPAAGGGTGCSDEIRSMENGDPAALGFPVSYSSFFIDTGNASAPPLVVSMEVTAFAITALDAALFEIRRGWRRR
jgi:hypothetical protein